MEQFRPDDDPSPGEVSEGERLTEDLLEALKPLVPVSEDEKERLWQQKLAEWGGDRSGNADDQ